MSPGLSGLLVDHLWRQLHVAEEIHVATHGTAGPACACNTTMRSATRRSVGTTAHGSNDPAAVAASLNWFPEPIGARDCYRAALPDPFLLHRMFPTASRISARVSGTRRDRLTARLPMLTPPHAAGDVGAVRVEVRGAASDGARVTLIAGASGPTGDLAAAVASACIEACLAGSLEPGVHLVGGATHRRAVAVAASGGAWVFNLQEFTGVARSTAW